MFENATEIILKVTRDCNFRCKYCYIKNKDDYIDERMNLGVFKKLIDRIVADRSKDQREQKIPGLQIVFHGGEPTLLGVESTEAFINYAQQRIPGVTFSIQTNLSLVNEHWAQLFAKYKINPGLSIDGISSIDNSFRNSRFTFRDKLNLLDKHGVNYGILLIISKTNIKNYMTNINGLRKITGYRAIKANYAENTLSKEAGDSEVSAEEMYQQVFIPTIKVLVRKHELIELNISEIIKKFVEKLVFDRKEKERYLPETNCSTKFCSGGNNVIEVDPDGDVCFCGRWSAINDVNKLGNFLTSSDIFGLNSFRGIVNLQGYKVQDMQKKHCDYCFAKDICNYGCIAFSYDKYDGEIKIREDLVCLYMKRVKRFLLRNQYQIIYSYVKANNWNISKYQKHTLLNIPLNGKDKKMKNIKDNNLEWVTLPEQKAYLAIPTKLIKKKIIWE